MVSPISILLSICFFLSGATSLILEVAWAKQLSYLLGNSVYATSTVVAAFMAGLALGSFIAGRKLLEKTPPLKAYAVMQFAIAAMGFFSIPIFCATNPVFALLYKNMATTGMLFLLIRFAFLFVLMVGPVTLMGMTLPIVVKARSQNKLSLGMNAGWLYGVNTVGAVSGTFLAGFLFIPWLGLLQTCMIAGTIDLAVGLAALGLHQRQNVIKNWVWHFNKANKKDTAVKIGQYHDERLKRTLLGTLFFCAGFLSMAYEMAWFRLLADVLGSTVHAFTSMLGTFLLGIGLGSLAGTKALQKTKEPLWGVAVLFLLIGINALLSLVFTSRLPSWYAQLFWYLGGTHTGIGYPLAQILIAAVVVFQATFCMGLAFPFVLNAYARLGATSQDRRNTSDIYSLNTIGGIIGSLVAGFFALPRLGITQTIVWASFGSGILGLVVIKVFLKGTSRVRRTGLVVASVGILTLLWLMVPNTVDLFELNRGVFFQMHNIKDPRILEASRDDDQILYYQEGLHGSVAITGPENLVLRISGKPVATSKFNDSVHLMLLGQLPMLFAPEPKRAAIIGLGAGITAGSLLCHSAVQSVDIIELEPGVVHALPYFKRLNNEPLKDHRTQLIVEDGRTHLVYSEKSYDIITSDPISPLIAGAGNLYSVDFYHSVAKHLAPKGIFCQWWQAGGVSKSTYRNILATMKQAFRHLYVFIYLNDTVVLGSNEPLKISWQELQRRFYQPEVFNDLKFFQFDSPLYLLNLFYGGKTQIENLLIGAQKFNSDDHPWLEHIMPAEHYKSLSLVSPYLIKALSAGRLEALSEMVEGLPLKAMARVMVKNPPLYFPETHNIIRREVEKEIGSFGQFDVLTHIPGWFAQRHQPGYRVHQFLKLENDYNFALSKNNVDQQEKCFKKILNIPEIPVGYLYGLRYVRFLIKQNRYEEALDVINRIIRRKAGFYQAYSLGAKVARAIDNPALATEYLTERKRFYPKDLTPVQIKARRTEDYKNWGVILRNHDKLNASLNQLRTALELRPDDSEVNYETGVTLLRMGDIEEAGECFQKVIKIRPEHDEAFNKMGMIYFNKGNFELALKQYKKAIMLNPNNAEVYQNWGVLLAYQKKLNEAINRFKKALDINPQSVMGNILLGQAYANLKRFDEAEESFKKALSIDPRNTLVLKNLGYLCYEQRQINCAVKYFQRAVDLVPDDADAKDKLQMLRKMAAERNF